MPLSALLASDPPTIGPYALHGRLGSGGMGVVYLAFGPQEEAVALKVLQPVLAQNREYRQRFVREVAAAGRVQSPYVARLLGSQTEGDQLWMATEYVEGATLQHAVETNGPVGGQRLRAFGADLAAGVADLHAVGLVHRDLKPANVVLAWSGPKLIDFGIAKPEDEVGLTETGAVVGSPLWLAPEVLEGRPATRASDVWGWALCIAYAGTGHPTFGSGDVAAVAYRIARAEPNLDGLPEDLHGLRDLLEAALDKDPTHRPTAPEIAQLLGAGGADVTRVTRPPVEGEHPVTVRAVANVPGSPAAGGRVDRRLVATMAVIAVLLIVIGAVTAVLVLRDGGGGSSAGPATSKTPTAKPSVPEPLIPAPTATVAAALSGAEAYVRRAGYTPNADAAKWWKSDQPINVIVAGQTGEADGYRNRAFFFAGNTFVENDATTPSRAVEIVSRSADTITLSYTLYEPIDPSCCPSGGHQDVTFQWDGYELDALEPIPPAGGSEPSR